MSACSDEEYFYKLYFMVIIRSTRHLRQVFKTRWKVERGQDWEDEPVYIQMFLNQHGGNILKKAMSSQKKILYASATMEDWDTSLMCLVLLNFCDRDNYKLENQAVRQLRRLRNYLAHHKSRKCTQSEYSEKVTIIKESLQVLEMEESEIDKLAKESGNISSLEITILFKLLLKNAELLIESQDFPGALQQYSEAIGIPRLMRDNLGIVYEKRAACYLSLNDESSSDGKEIDQAILDVQEALELNSNSWNAYYLYAQCNKAKNNLAEAIRYFEMALAISPVQTQLRKAVDSCKLLMNKQTANTQLNREQFPVTANDVLGKLAEIKDESGRNYTLKKYQKLTGTETHPLCCGDNYYYGLGVPQDYAEAVKFYSQADKEGFAGGTYKLGLCYYRGHGVEQDFGKALEIYRRCAKMDARKGTQFENFTPLGFNKGVSYSMHAIGECYEKGLAGAGVEKNMSGAAVWYERAMEHGHAPAAAALGILYWKGNGLARNEKMAEMCWKQGLQLGNSVAAGNLVFYYCHQLEPEMGWVMFRIAREMGHWKYGEMSDEQFNEELELAKVQSERCRLEGYVLKFEKQYNVDYKGMTFRERLTRAQQHMDPHCAKISCIGVSTTCEGKIQNIGKHVMVKVGIKGLHGSKTAIEVLKTIESITELNKLLKLHEDLSKTCQWKAVNLYYECMIKESHLKNLVKNDPKLQIILRKLFLETCEQVGEEDMKIRLSYVDYNLRSSLKSPEDYFALGILKEGIRRYPENYGYYRHLLEGLVERKSYESALQYVNEALEKFPEKADLYYTKADILQKSDVEFSEIIAAFKLFLANSPRDHRLVPEAYYKICYLYMEDYMRQEEASESEEKMKLMQEHFKLGKNAEKEQLPCYQPYGISDTQSIVDGFLKSYNQFCAQGGHLTSIGNTIQAAMVPLLKSVLERKKYLKSPVRKGLIIQHRERARDSVKLNRKVRLDDVGVVPWKLKQTRAQKMSLLKPITLQEMHPTKDDIFGNRILDLTIIEEPNLYSNSLQLVAQDRNGDTTRVYVDPLAAVNVLMERFAVGCRIAVINPYMGQCTMNEAYGIRINELKCVMFLRKAQDLCRFCGEEKSIRKCNKCKRLYCSEECQTLDKEKFKHKLICSKAP